MDTAAAPINYEYAIIAGDDLESPHRSGLTEDEAKQWIAEWLEMVDDSRPSQPRPTYFTIARRPIYPWEYV